MMNKQNQQYSTKELHLIEFLDSWLCLMFNFSQLFSLLDLYHISQTVNVFIITYNNNIVAECNV